MGKLIFFVEISKKPVCLVCGKHVVPMKKSNLQLHYDSCHVNLEKLTGQARQDKIAFLKRGLNAQQTALQSIARPIMKLSKRIMKLANYLRKS